MARKIISTPTGWPIIGTLGALIAAGGASKLHEFVQKRHEKFGPIYKEKIGPVTATFISNPDYMRKVFAVEGRFPSHIIPESWQLYNEIYQRKRGLLFMEREEWHHHRKILNNIFLRPDVTGLQRAVDVAANDLLASWEANPRPEDLEQQLYMWSLQSVIAVLVGAESYAIHKQNVEPILRNLSRFLHKIFIESGKLSLMPAKLAQKLNLPPWKRFVMAVNSTFDIANSLMEDLKKFDLDSNSVLAQMKNTEIKPEDLNRIAIDLILAAGDTTAYTMEWILYLLSQHSDIQQSLCDEISKNQESPVENQLIRGTIRETLRLYPVAIFLTRYLPFNIEIDGYLLKRDDLIIMSLYTSGRDEKSFPQPNQFQPDRWTRIGTQYKNVINSHASLPFAMGARSCIGRKIAEIQLATTLAKVKAETHQDTPREGK